MCCGRCAHPEAEIDTFDMDPTKEPDYTVDLSDNAAVKAMAGESVYDEILQEYVPFGIFEAASTLLKPKR